jgi:integrase
MADFLSNYKTTEITDISVIQERVRHYASKSRAANTLAAYKADFELWKRFCSGLGQIPYGCNVGEGRAWVIAAFITHEADRGKTPSTIVRRIAGVRFHYRQRGLALDMTDAVKQTLQGAKRTLGTAPKGKSALEVSSIMEIVDRIRNSNIKENQKLRDVLIILLGFSSAMRRSELVGLNAADITFNNDGTASIYLSRSKTDQVGQGRTIPLIEASNGRYCVISALKAWMGLIDSSGPLFRRIHRGGRVLHGRLSAYALCWRIKHWVMEIGEDPNNFGAHSLRSGFVTSAINAGAAIPRIQTVTGHKSVEILMSYYKANNLYEDHAMDGIL